MIRIVGTGPGTALHMTQEAIAALGCADVVVAGGRLLEVVDIPERIRRVELPASGMVDAVTGALEMASALGEVVLLVSGDPGFYSLARRVVRHFGRENVTIVPGISSLQIMAARIARSWVNVPCATLHGRDCPDLAGLAAKLHAEGSLVVLLGAADDAVRHMRFLAEDERLRSAWAAVGWDLGLPKEQVFDAPSLNGLLRCPYVGRLALLWLEREGEMPDVRQ